jgi:hypothetical protein
MAIIETAFSEANEPIRCVTAWRAAGRIGRLRHLDLDEIAGAGVGE